MENCPTGKPSNFYFTPLPLSGECGVVEEVSVNACVCSKCRHKEPFPLQRPLESENGTICGFFWHLAPLESHQIFILHLSRLADSVVWQRRSL